MQLWPHQEAAQAFIRENPWCTINHFCGTGKTPIGLETIKRYTIAGTWNLSVVVVPRLSLIHQWHQKLREMEYDGEFLSINSDDDIRDTCASIEFTTDVEEIKRKLLIAKRASTNMCITITYKSLHLLEATLNDASIQTRPDLVLLDEAHHITEKDVCTKLFDKNDPTVATIYASDSDTSSESESVSSDKSVNELKWKPFWVDIERMVFFTATPMNREGVVMDPELTDNIGQISIDEETLNEWKDEGLVPPLAEPKHVHPAFAGNSHCGPIHRYNHTEAVKDDRCNEFKIAIDLFPKHASSEKTLNATEQTRYELFCSISRAVLSTGNARVLTFHKQVKDSEETMCSVSAMATDDAKVLFCKAFRTVLNEEFEHKRSMYTDIERCINILTIDAKNSPEERTRILNTLDNSPDTDDTKYNNRVTIVASCETIGEGIDTKRCNMVVFVDVIRSFVKIIQRIGRATRRPPTSEPLPPATILLPVGIDVSNYADVQGDPDKRDECIRASMLSENQGDFGLMLNTFAAVRQTVPQLYSICLFYPGRFAPSEVKKNLVRHGFAVVEPDLNASDQARLDEEEDFYDEERVSLCTALAHGETSSVSADEAPLMDTLLEADDSNDAIQRYANRTGRTVEIHSTSMETPVRRIEPSTNPAEGSDEHDKVLYYDKTKNVYRPTQRVSQADDDDTPVSNTGIREGPPPRKRMVNVHTHPEVKVLWSLTSTNENDSLDLLTRHTQLGYIEATVDMKRAVTQWFDTLDALEAWMAAHVGIRPKQKAGDPTEKRLGSWMSQQQTKAKPPRNGIHAKNDSVHNAWNDHVARHKAIYRSHEEEWFDTLAELEAWMATNAGTRPSGSSKDPSEKRLAYWIGTQLKNANSPRKHIHAINDTVYNAWNDHVARHKAVYRTREEEWFDTLDALEAWIATHAGTRPSNSSNDPNEKRLATWINYQQTNANLPRKRIHAANDAVHNAWNEHVARHKLVYRTNDEVWFDTLATLEAWMAAHVGILPKHEAKDPNEKRLATWMSNQQKNSRTPRNGIHAKNDSVHNTWNDHVARHKATYRTNEEVWFKTLAELEAWMTEYEGKRPSNSAKDSDEKRLARWINVQKQNAKPPLKKIHARNNAVNGAWNEHVTRHKLVYRTNDEEWFDTLAEIETWMAAHAGKRPSSNSKDPAEKRLGTWVDTQQKNVKQPLKNIHATNDAVHNAWNDHVASHKVVYRTNEEEWFDTLAALEAWMAAHAGTRPKQKAMDPTEKRLAAWISTQQLKAKSPRKEIHATNDSIHDAWNDHVTRHKANYRTYKEDWFDTLTALEAWMYAHAGKRPSNRAKEPAEKNLARWIGTQQQNAKPPLKNIHATNDAVHNAWSEHVARHKAVYRTKKEEWFETLAELETWVVMHANKRPNQKAKNPTEKRLARWMSQQQHKAKPPKKDIHATNDAVHNAWNEHVLAHALTNAKKVIYSKQVVDAARAATQALTERIDAILAPYSLRSHDVGAAGDCQFRALADLLLDDAGRHAEVRAAVVAELTTHPERYREFMEEWDNRAVDTHQESYASYLERMAKSGTWGGNTTLLAAATVYGRRLMVVSAPVQEGSSYCTDVQPLLRETDLVATAETNDDAPPIWLAYMNGNHYRATRPLDNETGVTPSIPPSTKQEDVKDRIQRFKQASNDTPTSKPKPKTKKRKAKPKTKDPKPAANHKPPAHKGQTSTDSALSTKKQKVTTVEAPPPPSAPEPIDTTLTAQSLSTGPDTVSPKRAASDMAGSEEATYPTVRARRRRTSSSQAREQRRHAQEDAMRKFQNKEQLTDSEHQLIQQILSNNNSRASPDDSYSDDHHNNVDHVNWKQSMNDTFVDLLKRYAPTGGNVIYMDGPSGLTTHTLRRAGVGWTTHVANDCESNAGQLSQLVDRYEMDDVREAMRTTWADVPFIGAYLDTCAGKAETVEDMLQTLVTRTRYGSEHDAPIVLGYTITPRDPSGQNLYERVQRLQKFVNNLCKSQGYRVVKVDEQFDECPNICTNFTHNSVVTHFVVLHRM